MSYIVLWAVCTALQCGYDKKHFSDYDWDNVKINSVAGVYWPLMVLASIIMILGKRKYIKKTNKK